MERSSIFNIFYNAPHETILFKTLYTERHIMIERGNIIRIIYVYLGR